jgi:Family of unknown function (DUF6492)
MPNITIVTPSFRPDLDRCELLAESIARFASSDYRHVVIVPRADWAEFNARLGRHGAVVLLEEELLPSWLVRLPFSRKWQLTPRGWPVRGWVRQQVVKIAYACLSSVDALLFADSDTCFVKPFDAGLVLRPDGRVKLLSEPGVGDTPIHHEWYRRSSHLLGIPVKDYYGRGFIGNMVPWVPEHVRALVRHIEAREGRDWKTVLLHQRTMAEYVLYGLFIENVLGLSSSRHFVDDRVRPVLEYWTHDQLSDERLLEFLGTLSAHQLAIHIQSKTDYSFDVYARMVRNLWRGLDPSAG